MEGFEKIVVAIGGWVVLTIVLAQFIAQRIADNLKIRWSREQEEKLEKLRAEITHEHSIFTTILNSYSSGHQFAQLNRIEAVQTLWNNVLELRKLGRIPSLFFGNLLATEYNQVYDKQQMMDILNDLSASDTIKKQSNINDDVEKYRPFLGEYLWNLYKAYSILVGRVVWLLAEGRDNRNIVSWHKDEHLRSVLNVILTTEERTSIYSRDTCPFDEGTRILEQKMLDEMFKVISGELAAESNLSTVKKLQEVMKNIPTTERKPLVNR